jgi:hypothetical protein
MGCHKYCISIQKRRFYSGYGVFFSSEFRVQRYEVFFSSEFRVQRYYNVKVNVILRGK